jgi:hypothetical protein
MGFPAAFYAAFARHLFALRAEEFPKDSGAYRHVIHKSSDPNSEVRATIESISVGPEDNKLKITVEGEYPLDYLPDPDYTLSITFAPTVDSDGLLSWGKPNVEVDLSLLGDALGWLIVGLATAVTGGTGFFPSIVVLKTGQELILEPWVTNEAREAVLSEFDASFFDALPARLTIERRRWDPFYWTLHQVAGRVTEVVFNERGFAFTGIAVLTRQPEHSADAVVRDVQRDSQEQMSSLRYRVQDIVNIAPDLELDAPAAERWEFTQTDPRAEPMLVDLTIAQATQRVIAQRLVSGIPYLPRKAEVVNNQIAHLKLLSGREMSEERERILAAVRESSRVEIEGANGSRLREEARVQRAEELGREPTEDEIEAIYQYQLGAAVEQQVAAFARTELEALVNPVLERLLRLELTPAEAIDLSSRDILRVAGKEIFHRLGTLYLRDHPDSDRGDNLLALPRYRRPGVPA